MIKYKFTGAILTVGAGTADFGQASDLSVLADGEDVTWDFAPVPSDEGWELRVPAELYDGSPHRIVLRTMIEGEEIERIVFSFVGSGEVLNLNS